MDDGAGYRRAATFLVLCPGSLRGGDRMEHDLWGSVDAEVQRSAELRRLAQQMESCAARVEHVLARCREIQMLEWKSPAGNAYRDTVQAQAAALRRTADRLSEGSTAILFRVHELPVRGPGAPGFSRWP